MSSMYSTTSDSQERLTSGNATVAVAQMTCTPNVEANFHQGRTLIEKAAERGAKMVFLPECFDFVGETRSNTLSLAKTYDGITIPKYQELAKLNNVWLSLGGYHEKVSETEKTGRIKNTHVIISSEGNIQGQYNKTHLFDLDIKGGVQLKETDSCSPGRTIGPPVTTPVGKVGMAICYDLRFPEISIALTQQGAEILTYPSAFTVPTGMAHWQVLLQSRAIENQCYVIAAAQVGKHHDKRSSYGHSMIVDPWGCVIAQCSDKPDVAVAEIDLDYLYKRRREMPVQQHRRPDLYGTITLNTDCDIDSQLEYKFGQYSVKSSHVFYRTPLSYACVNKKPILPGHMLVCPITCVERFSDLDHSQVADLFRCVQTVSKIIEKQYGGTSLTIAIQDGSEAGQSVKHVHVHILPRKKGDFKQNDDIYNKLQTHDKDEYGAALSESSRKWRTEEDMAQEAVTLRKLFI